MDTYRTAATSLSGIGTTEHSSSEMIQAEALATLSEADSVVVSPEDIAGSSQRLCTREQNTEPARFGPKDLARTLATLRLAAAAKVRLAKTASSSPHSSHLLAVNPTSTFGSQHPDRPPLGRVCEENLQPTNYASMSIPFLSPPNTAIVNQRTGSFSSSGGTSSKTNARQQGPLLPPIDEEAAHVDGGGFVEHMHLLKENLKVAGASTLSVPRPGSRLCEAGVTVTTITLSTSTTTVTMQMDQRCQPHCLLMQPEWLQQIQLQNEADKVSAINHPQRDQDQSTSNTSSDDALIIPLGGCSSSNSRVSGMSPPHLCEAADHLPFGTRSASEARNSDVSPCSTLVISNLGDNLNEGELGLLLSMQPGFKWARIVRGYQQVLCLADFNSVELAAVVHVALQGMPLHSSDRGPIRICFAREAPNQHQTFSNVAPGPMSSNLAGSHSI